MSSPLLELAGVSVAIDTPRGTVHPVREVGFAVPAGGSVGLVGESGSGKSLTALAIMRLLPEPGGRIASGAIRLDGTDLATLPEPAMQDLRGRAMGMIFQEPMTSLNPVLTVGDQVAETLTLHGICAGTEARRRAVDMLALVGIPDPARRARDYPHQLSGGMRQRVMIASALVCRPRLLVADEPTTALDVTIQAQILDLLRRLRQQLGMAVLLITHDLGVIAEFVETVVVMYAGRVVERADVRGLFRAPAHPYTEALLHAVPKVRGPIERLAPIPGAVPGPADVLPGCRFQPRCPQAQAICAQRSPPEFPVTPTQSAACWKHVGFQAP